MRRAALGALLLGVFAFTFGSPLREFLPLHGIVSLAGLAGYVALSLDAGLAGRRERGFLIAGALAGLASFLLVVLHVPGAVLVARVLAVATVALPLWPLAGAAQFAFVAAAALALFTGLPWVSANPYATSVHAYLTAGGAFWVAWRLHSPGGLPGRKPKRLVVASNIVAWTPEQKARRLAELEARFKAGDLPEHAYWDRRQEIESK